MTETMIMAIFAILMIAAAVCDIRTMHIPVWLAVSHVILGAIAVADRMMRGRVAFADGVLTIMIISVIVIMSGIMRLLGTEAVGIGDVILITALGLTVSGRTLVMIVCLSLGLSGLFSGIMLILKRVGGKSRIPFVPFLTAGTVMGMLMNIRGIGVL